MTGTSPRSGFKRTLGHGNAHWANRLLAGAILLLVIAAANHLRRSWDVPGKRYLLVHADDAGLCAAANRATIAAMERGVVSSASVMVPCPGFDKFAAYARSHPEKDIGVHVTLTSEWDDVRWGPVSDPADVPSLVDADGTFWRTDEQFAQSAEVSEVETEIRAQIERARRSGIVISHLDNHMNSLFHRPDLMEAFVRIALDEAIPLRFAKTLPAGWEQILPAEVVDAYYAQLKVLYTHKNPLADFIEADNYQVPAADKRSYFLRAVRNLEPGVTEIVVHCCDTETHDWAPPDGDRRYADAATFLSPEMMQEITLLDIEVIDWRDFLRMTQNSHRRHW